MKKNSFIILTIILIGLIVVLGIVFGMNIDSRTNNNSLLEETQNSDEILQPQVFETPTEFSWHFEEADSFNLDGFLQTDIFLEIGYTNDATEKQLVDTVDGGCSELAGETYDRDISNTGRVQCYYAGFGQQYRITQDEEAYFVERRFFEEFVPNVTPINYEWEIIADIS